MLKLFSFLKLLGFKGSYHLAKAGFIGGKIGKRNIKKKLTKR